MKVSLKTLPSTFLHYGLLFDGEVRKILVDLNSNYGRYESLLHRIDVEFDSLSNAVKGDTVIASSGELRLVALVQYECGKCETIYYADQEPSDQLYNSLEPIAIECYYRPNDCGGFFKKCLLPEEFLRLNIALRALCDSVESESTGKLYLVLNDDGNLIDVSPLRMLGIEATVVGDMICIAVKNFGFEQLHYFLSCVYVALDCTELSIQGIEFDLRK